MSKLGLCLFLVVVLIRSSTGTLEEDINEEMNNVNGTESLSRKRRYLVFPTGSSLQLVYCLTVPSVGMGQIFTLGHTAALAWELPDKAEFIRNLKDKKFHQTTTTEAPETTTLPHLHLDHDDHGDPHNDFQFDYSIPHPHDPAPPMERFDLPPRYPFVVWGNHPSVGDTRKTYYNPFFINKRPATVIGYSPVRGLSNRPSKGTLWRNSIAQGGLRRKVATGQSSRPKLVTNSPKQYNKQQYKAPTSVNSYIHPVYHQHYRRTRRDLYGKIEKLFTALNKDGRSCLLKAICEVSQVAQRKGSFMEEVLKAIFRIKPHDSYPDEDDYDTAANKRHNCTEQYPTCDGSIWSNMLSF